MPSSPAQIEEHRQQSYALWQQMAARWERHRGALWASSRLVSERLVERLAPSAGDTVLDVAAGTGETGFLAAARLRPGGRLISSDFAPEMVEAAKRIAAELDIDNVEFRVLDAEQMELADDRVDGVLCRWGYMLMGDPGQALRETRRVLRSQGRLAFSVWAGPEHNPWMTVPGQVMSERQLLPPRRPDGPGMFSMSEPETVARLLEVAGFQNHEIEEMNVSYAFADGDELWTFVSELQGPIALAITKLSEDQRRELRAVIEERAAPFRRDEGYDLPGVTLNVTAT